MSKKNNIYLYIYTYKMSVNTLITDTKKTWANIRVNNEKIDQNIILLENEDNPNDVEIGQGNIWVKNTNPTTLFFTNDNNEDINLTTGGEGSQDLQETYNNSANGIINLSSGIGPIIIKDAETPLIGSLFEVSDNTINKFFEINNLQIVNYNQTVNTENSTFLKNIVLVEVPDSQHIPTASTGSIFVKNTNPTTLFYQDNVGTEFLLNNTQNLQQTYLASEDGEINLNSDIGGIIIKDDIIPVTGSLFSVESDIGDIYFNVDSDDVTVGTSLKVDSINTVISNDNMFINTLGTGDTAIGATLTISTDGVLVGKQRGEIQRSTVQNIADSTDTQISFSQAQITSNIDWIIGDPAKITKAALTTESSWIITYKIYFPVNFTGSFTSWVSKNGLTGLANPRYAINSITNPVIGNVINATGFITMSPGDYISLYVFQNSGGPVNIGYTGASTYLYTEIKIIEI